MYYSELVKKACVIMYDAHKEDKDKGGYPYVFHPFYLATQMDDEESTCVALLHDVVEDHGARYSFAYLEQAGFPESVIHALRLLTHTTGVPYMDSVSYTHLPRASVVIHVVKNASRQKRQEAFLHSSAGLSKEILFHIRDAAILIAEPFIIRETISAVSNHIEPAG